MPRFYHANAVELLLADLRATCTHDKSGAVERTILRRLYLFETMHMPEPEPITRYYAVLRSGKEYFVLDEYYPGDYGRCHVINSKGSRFGHFHKDDMSLEYAKVAIDIHEIVYTDTKWPDDLRPGYETTLTYFGVNNEN